MEMNRRTPHNPRRNCIGAGLGRACRKPLLSRELAIEQLETRSLLSGAPALVIGPLELSAQAGTSPATSSATRAGDSAPAASGTSASAPLSPQQVAQETAIAQAINAFGLELYSALQQQAGGSGNLVFSPLSVSAALAMAYAGANGETASQMASVLHFSGDEGAVEQEFGTLLTALNNGGQGNYTLSVANALWGQQGMQILTPFLQTMQADFAGGLQQVDFHDDPQGALQTINAWVARNTAGLIQNLLSPADVTALTRLVLVNAVYFKGTWATAFDANLTQNASFTLDSGDQVQAPMMHSTGSYGIWKAMATRC